MAGHISFFYIKTQDDGHWESSGFWIQSGGNERYDSWSDLFPIEVIQINRIGNATCDLQNIKPIARNLSEAQKPIDACCRFKLTFHTRITQVSHTSSGVFNAYILWEPNKKFIDKLWKLFVILRLHNHILVCAPICSIPASRIWSSREMYQVLRYPADRSVAGITTCFP